MTDNTSWIVITARKGNGKNRWIIDGHGLVEWVLARTGTLGMCRIVTTDDDLISQIAMRTPDTIFVRRPEWLASGDPGKQAEAVLHAMNSVGARPDDIVHLCQPTSPFVRTMDVERADKVLRTHEEMASVQTVVKVPHAYHEINQRYLYQECVGFVHEELRRDQPNKQNKPERWAFGNLVSTRVADLRDNKWFFNQPSRAITIDRYHALDVDDAASLLIARAYVRHGLVDNPWSSSEYEI